MKNRYKFKTPQLCNALGVTRMTLYTWEQKGFFTPPRNMKGDRVFTREQLKSIMKAFNPGGKRRWHFRG